MNPILQFNSRRSPVYGRGGMVAASQTYAVAAGLRILDMGGTAADAAIAAAAALNVTEPGSTGLGGDCFALYYDAGTKKVSAMNGSGRAPAALTLERVRQAGFSDRLPALHPYNVTVPGACAGWFDLVERFGRLTMPVILAPAIQLAQAGFPVAPLTAHYWQGSARGTLARGLNGQELTIDGRGPNPGEIFRNPGLARTLRLIAEGGKSAYYEGTIGEALAATVAEAGGCLSLEDLAAHRTTWEEPISTIYHSVRVWECPPNGQGLAALLALNLLEGFDLQASGDALSPSRLHLLIEAMRLAFADARRYVADPTFSPAPLEGLLSKDYTSQRRGLILPDAVNPRITHGTPFASSDTVYLSVVDGQGNACSFINSNYMGFGTGIVPRGFGFALQNRGNNFSLDPQHPNALAARKRPYHTIIPALATDADDNLFACYGVMGGFMQPQGHMQVTVGMIDDALDPQAALDRPRFCLEDSLVGPDVALEEGIPDETVARLAKMGHRVTVVRGLERSLFGRGQIIRRDPRTGVLCGGSDPRADGCAMGMT